MVEGPYDGKGFRKRMIVLRATSPIDNGLDEEEHDAVLVSEEVLLKGDCFVRVGRLGKGESPLDGEWRHRHRAFVSVAFAFAVACD
ncbi:MAG: hypothetical protein IT371_30865 [Deltaproteobacteria bacterium]|nr:hypothetical protein [Deltaproteobacteria bacterium]